MKSLSLYKIIYLLTVLALLPFTGHCQQYAKDMKDAEDAYRKGDYFDAVDFSKKAYTDAANDQLRVFKATCICKIADCYWQICDYERAKQWYAKAKKCQCIDSNIANQYIAEAGRRMLKADTTIKFVRYATCDDCNEGHWVPKGSSIAATSKDTCHFSLTVNKGDEKDTTMHIDSVTLGRGGSCTYMLDLAKCGKEVTYWLFEADGSGNKIKSLYLRNVYKRRGSWYGMDVTYLPVGTYLFYAYCDDSRQEYIIHLK